MQIERQRRRLFLHLWIIVALWLVFLARLGQLTLRPQEGLRERARSVQQRTETLSAARGEILDRHGRVLVTNRTTWSLWGNPKHLLPVNGAVELVAELKGVPLEKARAWLRARPQRWQCLVPEVGAPGDYRPGILSRFGMELREDHDRLYPEGALASHVLGFVGRDGHGLEGVELVWDEKLAGTPGWVARANDGAGGHYAAAGLPIRQPVAGANVMLTLDQGVQEATEVVLAEAIERWGARAGTILVVEPSTGDLIALANWPTYHPALPGDAPASHRRNRAVTDMMEPGSTLKVVLASLLLQQQSLTGEEMVYAEAGRLPVRGGSVRDTKVHEWLSFREAFEVSSNISFYKLSSLADPDQFYRALRDFGFGVRTGVALPGEACGILRPPSAWSARSQGTLAFGQEIAVTPLQLAMSYAAIANGGVLMAPRAVVRVESAEGKVLERIEPRVCRRVIDSATAARVTSLLEGVVAEGTGSRAALPGVRVAGKTGTAQKPDLKAGGYKAGAYLSSFVGFFPVEDPQYVIYVLLDEPDEEYYGGQVAAPVFRELAARILPLTPAHGGVTTDPRTASAEVFSRQPASLEPIEAGLLDASEVARALAGATRALQHRGGHRHSADKASSSRAPAPETTPAAGTPAKKVSVPDLVGSTLREGRRSLAARGLSLRAAGSGVVIGQRPAPGTMVSPGTEVSVRATLPGLGRSSS